MARTSVDKINKKSPGKTDDIFSSIHKIMHLFRSEQYRVLRNGPYTVTHLEGKLLGFFARHPDATLSDLVLHLKQDKGQLARLVKSLRAQGLLEGEGNTADRRRVKLRLTAEGKSIHQALQQQVQALSKLAIRGLSTDQRSLLVDMLHQVRSNLESVSEKSKP